MEEPHLETPVNGEAMVMEEPDLSLSKGRDPAPLLKDKPAISEDFNKSENDGSIATKGHSEDAAEDLNDSSVNGSNDLVSAEELKKLNACGHIVVSEDCVGVNGSGDKDTINNEMQNGNSEKLIVDGEKMAIRENGDASANESAENKNHETMGDQNGLRLAAESVSTLKSDENVREQSEIVLNQITASSSLPLVHDSKDSLSGALEEPNITSNDSQLSSAGDRKEQKEQKEEEKEQFDKSQVIEDKEKQSHDKEGMEEVAQTKEESLEQTTLHQGGTVNIEQVITEQGTEEHKTNEMEVAAVAEYSEKKQEQHAETDYTSQCADVTVEEKSLENNVEKENYTVLSETPNENPDNLLTGNDTLMDQQLSPCNNSPFVMESFNSLSQHKEEEKPALEDTTENQTREEDIKTVSEAVKENINANISLGKCNQEELITQETSEITKRVTDNELGDNTEVEQEISQNIKVNICVFGDSESLVKPGEICEQGTEQSSNSDYEEKYETEEVENINKRNSSSVETKVVSDEGAQQRTDSLVEHTDDNNMEVTVIENEAKLTKEDIEDDNTVLKEEIIEETVNTNSDVSSEHEDSKNKELQADVEGKISEGKSNEDIKESDDEEGPALPLSPPPDQPVFQGVETRGRLSSAGLGRERTSWLYAHMLNETSGEDDAIDADEDKAVDREKQGEDDEVGAEMTEEEQGLDSNIKTVKESENKENKDMDGQVEQGVNVDVAMMTKAGKQDLNTSKRVGKDELDSHGKKDELDSQGTDKSNEENKESSDMNNELQQEEKGAHYLDETKEEEKNEGKNAGDQEAKDTDTQTTEDINNQEDKCKVNVEEENTNKDCQNEIDKQNIETKPQTTQQELSAISKQEEDLMLREVSEVEILGGREEKDKHDGKEERTVVEEGSGCITEKPDREIHKQVEQTAVHQGGTVNVEQVIIEQGTEEHKTNEVELTAVAEKKQEKHADTEYTSQTNADDTVTSMSDTDRHEEAKTDTTEATDKYIQLDTDKHDESNSIENSVLIETRDIQITKISATDMQETATEETDIQISKTDSENQQVTRDYKEDATDEPEHQQEPTDSDPEVDQTIQQQSKQDQETRGLQRLTCDSNNQSPADKSCNAAITDTEEEGQDLMTRREVETNETDIKEERRVQEEEGKELETKETDIKEERRVQEEEEKELEKKKTAIKERKEHETKERQEEEMEIDTKKNVVDGKKELEASGKEAEKDQTQTENHKQELHKETNTEPSSSTEKEDSIKDQVAVQDNHKAATEDLTPQTDKASAHKDAQESETNEQQLPETNQSEPGEEKNVTADTKEIKTEVKDSTKTEEEEAQTAAIVDAEEEDKELGASGDEQIVEESKKENCPSEGDEATATTKVKKGKKTKKKCTVM